MRLVFALCVAWYSARIRADESRDGFAPQVWLNPGTFSYHFDRDKALREDNTGIGAELMLADDHVMSAGSFINSNR